MPATEQIEAAETRAAYWPQGTCPKPWVALVDGKALRDGRGGVRRFSTEKAAERAVEAGA